MASGSSDLKNFPENQRSIFTVHFKQYIR